MRSRPAAGRLVLAAAMLALSLSAGLGATARPADASVFGFLKTFPVSVDVTLSVSEHTTWTRARTGTRRP